MKCKTSNNQNQKYFRFEGQASVKKYIEAPRWRNTLDKRLIAVISDANKVDIIIYKIDGTIRQHEKTENPKSTIALLHHKNPSGQWTFSRLVPDVTTSGF